MCIRDRHRAWCPDFASRTWDCGYRRGSWPARATAGSAIERERIGGAIDQAADHIGRGDVGGPQVPRRQVVGRDTGNRRIEQPIFNARGHVPTDGHLSATRCYGQSASRGWSGTTTSAGTNQHRHQNSDEFQSEVVKGHRLLVTKRAGLVCHWAMASLRT